MAIAFEILAAFSFEAPSSRSSSYSSRSLRLDPRRRACPFPRQGQRPFPPVTGSDCARHVGGVVARQIHVGPREFGRLSGAAERSVLAERREPLGVPSVAGMSGVQIGPGATAFTRMPFGPSSSASAFENATCAAFVIA